MAVAAHIETTRAPLAGAVRPTATRKRSLGGDQGKA